jgi:predicted  nucleic acid-binding Zn-ribbon protein
VSPELWRAIEIGAIAVIGWFIRDTLAQFRSEIKELKDSFRALRDADATTDKSVSGLSIMLSSLTQRMDVIEQRYERRKPPRSR